MKKKYYIGLDGGGTKTQCVITDENLKPLYECNGGPSNFLLIGTKTVSETILGLIKQSVNHLSISNDQIESIVIGTAGAGRQNDADKLKIVFKTLASDSGFDFKSFQVEHDARIALEGAFSGLPGSILIAGTGSIMFGKDKSNNLHRVGGFGRYIGDEGSGGFIGRKGLSAVAKDFDGRGKETMLTSLLAEKYEIVTAPQLITEIYSNNFHIANMAPLVIKAAAQGDEICHAILDDNIEELILHIRAMQNKIKEDLLRLCLVGGAISTDNYYADMLKTKVKDTMPSVKIVNADLPPVMGAALMAKNSVL